MGKRSPHDTTPPNRIIDWASEAERAFMNPPKKPQHEPLDHTEKYDFWASEAEKPWYELLEGAAKDDFFGVPAEEEESLSWLQRKQKMWPSLPPEFGLPPLPCDVRQRTLRIEGHSFRKKYDGRGGFYMVGKPECVFDAQEEIDGRKEFIKKQLSEGCAVYPECERTQFNTGFPGTPTIEGFRLMDDMVIEPGIEEFEDLPISGGVVFWLMKKAKKERLKKLQEKREEND